MGTLLLGAFISLILGYWPILYSVLMGTLLGYLYTKYYAVEVEVPSQLSLLDLFQWQHILAIFLGFRQCVIQWILGLVTIKNRWSGYQRTVLEESVSSSKLSIYDQERRR